LGLQMEAEKDRGSEDAKREAFGRLQPQPQTYRLSACRRLDCSSPVLALTALPCNGTVFRDFQEHPRCSGMRKYVEANCGGFWGDPAGKRKGKQGKQDTPKDALTLLFG
jgi:hypothetical protein